jgi:TfoX/Sxy family transcriptional regulator of competence genes
MAYDENLADRIRAALGAQRGIDEIKMFGGLCFTLNGNMACGVMRDDLLVRVPTDAFERLLKEPGARTMDMMAGRTPKGFLVVDAAAVSTKPKLQKWLARGVDVAESLPAKAKGKASGRGSAKGKVKLKSAKAKKK